MASGAGDWRRSQSDTCIVLYFSYCILSREKKGKEMCHFTACFSLYFTYCNLLIRIVFCQVSWNLSLYCLFYVTMNMYFYFYSNIVCNVVTVLHWSVDMYHFNYTFSLARIQAHTHTEHTCMISAQEEWREPGRRHRNPLGRGRAGFVRDKGLAHTLWHTHTWKTRHDSTPRSQT